MLSSERRQKQNITYGMIALVVNEHKNQIHMKRFCHCLRMGVKIGNLNANVGILDLNKE
jgi:hypothetical protein